MPPGLAAGIITKNMDVVSVPREGRVCAEVGRLREEDAVIEIQWTAKGVREKVASGERRKGK